MSNCNYEELAHTADIGMRVRASTLPELFRCAACGLFAVIIRAMAADYSTTRDVVVESHDSESLVVDWLNELLYWHAVTGAVYDKVVIHTLTSTYLEASISGGPPRNPPDNDIKATTFYGLRLHKTADEEWAVDVFFDV